MPAKNGMQTLITATLALVIGLLAWLIPERQFAGDELRYLEQASNWLNGEGMYPDRDIGNPPLLPWILATGQKAGLAVEQLPILSILAMVLATVLLRGALSHYVSPRWATVIALLIWLHPAMLMLGPQLLTEPWAILGSSLVAYGAVLLVRRDTAIAVVTAVVTMALGLTTLALLKGLFGYALAAVLVPVPLLYLYQRRHHAGVLATLRESDTSHVTNEDMERRKARVKRTRVDALVQRNLSWRKHVLCFSSAAVLSLALCSPFLVFMHSVSGSHFSWGTAAGDHLYWLAIGGEDVWGSWFPDDLVFTNQWLIENGYASEIARARTLSAAERDAYMLELTFNRIKNDPLTYATNLLANTGRLLFNYPYTFRPQSLGTYGFIMPNMALFFTVLALLPAAWLTRHRQAPILLWVLLYYLIYLGGNVIVDTTARQSIPLLPVLFVWIAQQARLLIDHGVVNIAAWQAPPHALASRLEPEDSSSKHTVQADIRALRSVS